MSNLPKAKAILNAALEGELTYGEFRDAVREAMTHMHRKNGQRAKPRSEKLNLSQARAARRMRFVEGKRLHEIGQRFGVSQGAVQRALGYNQTTRSYDDEVA